MPAKRPRGDALAIWLIVKTLWDEPVTQESVFMQIRESLVKHVSRKRGTSPCIDAKRGRIVGDCLSFDRVEGLYKQACRLLADDRGLALETECRLGLIKAKLAEKPDSILLPLRQRGPEKTTVVVQLRRLSPGEVDPNYPENLWELSNVIAADGGLGSLAIDEFDDPDGAMRI